MKASERRWYLPWPALVKCVMVLAVLTAVKGDTIYMNQFAVRVPGGAAVAEDLARRLGFTNLWQIGTLQNYFVLEHKRIAKRSAAPGVEHHRALREATEVEWVQQQVEHRRTKRDIYPSRNSTSRTREKRSRSPQSLFPDPLYKEQWYLNGATAESLDMRIPDAWAKGYTGKGIVVSILDDGIQSKHPDLMANYDPLASGDINDNDTDPAPRDDGDNKHGTRCAGEVAAEAFNDVCGVGVAYRASIGGVRMLDGTVNDAVEAAALSTNPSHIDIYSASWGPEDDGKTVDGPGPLARRAFLQGVTNGRKGKGSIFVWASGNGGRHTDSCNCDGYTNSIFTLSISSATQYGYKPWYLEECSSTLATTYSSGTPGRDKSVATVDMDGKLRPGYICTTDHTGTSASAPLAAGMCALALEANSQLTWRDMQHLVVRSSRAAPLEKESGWSVNGAKRRVSHKFGYGLIDASAMVALAETWTPVPPQHICKSQVLSEERPIDRAPGTAIEMQVDVNGCRGTANEIRFLEHVQCRVTLTFAPRGALRIVLTSPMGTTSTLLSERPLDDSESLDDWAFLSVHFWGERADGRWTLRVENNANKPIARPGVLRMWQLVLYGTATDPTPQNGSSSSNNAVVDRSQQPGVIDGAAVAVELVPLVNSVAGDSRSGIEYQTEVVATPPPHRLILHDCDHECLEAAGCYGRGPTVCVACKHYKLDNTCVSRCPPRSYLSRDATCQPCHETCETCAGPGHDACLTCAPAHLRLADLGVCIQECPESYYEDAARLSCIACSANCLSCGEQPDRCTTCDRLLVMHNQRCFAACPPGTFNVTADRCEECHPSCDTCSGPGESQCISCPSGRLFLSGACLRACPEGWFPDKRVHECAACPLGCTLCTTQGCRVCAAGWVLGPDGRCARDGAGRCNPGEYVNGTTCTQCHSSCATCHSDGPDACLSCPPDAPLLFAGRCRAVCPDGSFPVVGSPPGDTDLWTTIGSNGHIIDPGPARCARCPHNCRSCVSRQNCTACSPGLRLQSGQCRVACADGYYSDGGVCAACYLSCATCTGPHKDECVTCPRGWQLLDGQCHPDCPQGHYTTRFGCAKCHHTCRSCIGPGPANCSSCVARRALTSDGRCTLCVRGEFYDAANRRCAPCHPSCAACAGPGRLACTACIPPLQLHKRRSQCMPCCGPTPSALAAAVGDDGPAADACCKCDSHTDSGICPDVSSAGKRRIAEPSLDWRPSSGSASSAQLPGLINPSVAVASSEVAASLVRTEDALPQVYSWPLPNATTTATLAAAAVAAATIVIAVVVTVIRTRQRRLPNQSSVLTGEVETPKLEGCVSNGFRITDDSFRVTLSRGRGRGRSHRTKSSQAEQQCLLAANSCEDVDDLDSLSLPT